MLYFNRERKKHQRKMSDIKFTNLYSVNDRFDA